MDGDIEVRAVMDRFAALVEDWDLDAAEVAGLLALGESGQLPAAPPLPAETEHRMRLLVELDRDLRAALSPGALRDWLHTDRSHDGVTPVSFLSGGLVNIRAMRAAARGLP